MEETRHYDNLIERNAICKEYEALNKTTGSTWRMLYDNFDNPDWKQGDPIVGTMTFTDESEPTPPVIPENPDKIILKKYLADPHSGLPDLNTAFQALARLYLGV